MRATPFRVPFLLYAPPHPEATPTHIMLLQPGSTCSKDPPHTRTGPAWASGLLSAEDTSLNSAEHLPHSHPRFPKVGPGSESLSVLSL